MSIGIKNRTNSTSPTYRAFAVGLVSGVLIALSLLSTNLAAAEPERHSDPKGRVLSYVLPAGWDNERFNNGRNFTRTGILDDSNILGVIPRERDAYSTLENIRRDRSAVNAVQNHIQRSSKVYDLNGFQVWEAIYDAQIRGRNVVFHDVMIFSDNLMIEVHLNASKPVYESYLPDLQTVVLSMREVE